MPSHFSARFLEEIKEAHSSLQNSEELINALREAEAQRELAFHHNFVEDYWQQADACTKDYNFGEHDAVRKIICDHMEGVGFIVQDELDKCALDTEYQSPLRQLSGMDPAVLATVAMIQMFSSVIHVDTTKENRGEVGQHYGVRPVMVAEAMAGLVNTEYKVQRLRSIQADEATPARTSKKLKKFFDAPTAKRASYWMKELEIEDLSDEVLLKASLWLINAVIHGSGGIFYLEQFPYHGWCLSISSDQFDVIANRLDTVSLVRPSRGVCFAPPMEHAQDQEGGRILTKDPLQTGFNPIEKGARGVKTKGDWTQHRDAINAHQNTGWRVNQKVLDVAEYVWQNFPLGRLNLKRQIPVDVPAEDGPLRWNALKTNKQIIRPAARSCQRTFDWFSQMRDIPSFWYTLTADSRGRLKYLSGDNPNPHGNDLSRGTLEFSMPTRLGMNGVYWLIVGVGTLAGHDKLSFEDRHAWTTDNLELLFDIAANPTSDTSLAFLDELDEPFQFLAALFELYECLQLDNPEDYASHCKIPFDATCSGYQFIGAMTGDRDLMTATNVLPTGKRGDLYLEVGNAMYDILHDTSDDSWYKTEGDLKDPSDPEQLRKLDIDAVEKLRSLWADAIPRKAAKRSMMMGYGSTTVFGQSDGFDMIKADLFPEYLDPITGKSVRTHDGSLSGKIMPAVMLSEDEQNDFDYDRYVEKAGLPVISKKLLAVCAKLLIRAVGQRFPGLMEYLNWVSEMTISAGNAGLSISWYAPSGIYIDHSYMKMTSNTVEVIGCDWSINKAKLTDVLDVRKAATAIGPNLIHSFDAGMLILVVNRFMQETAAMNIATVHDCALLSPANVEEFLDINRQVFHGLFAERDQLEEIWGHNKQRVERAGADPEFPFPNAFPRKEFDLSPVLESEFFWS